MGSSSKLLLAVSTVLILAGGTTSKPAMSDNHMQSAVEEGKTIAEDRKKGNCFACHDYEGAVQAGTVGPKLINMKARYPTKEGLRDQIWDATKKNPNTIMPPFGRHEILSNDELDKLVEFIYSL
jgi:sulfur-oxidizing protein SoxX